MMSRVSFLLLILLCLPAQAEDYNLPDFGDGNAVSLNQEYYMGRAWLMSFRRQAPILDDALLQDYNENLVYKLAVSSQLKDRRLEVVLVDNATINAFAVPGGVVGIHSGLIAKAQNEAQFTSVIGHELAHVSQRHFIRGVEARKKSSVAMMAGLLGGLAAIAAGAGDAGVGAIMGGQAAAQQSSLSYSRSFEKEADRLGMQTQARAGFDPGGAAGMFEVMQAESRKYGSRPPEFLLTHPLTETRIADARNRAATYPKKIYQDNPEFQLMRARVKLSLMKDDDAALAHFQKARDAGGRGAVPAQYGLVLAHTRAGNYDTARELLAPMREFKPDSITYTVAQADIDIAQGRSESAITLLERKLELTPGNHPMTMSLAKAYEKHGDYALADELLSGHVRDHASNASIWYQLAEVQGKAGNLLGLHQSRAEYFALNGAMQQAIEQLNLALPKATNPITVERIHTRINYFHSIARALGQLG